MKKYIYILLGLIIPAVNLSAQNTMSTAINLGAKNSGFTYSNTQNTANYTNDYVGRPSNDVFYKFTLSCSMEITISHCNSEVYDTYLHVLDASGNLITDNDDSGDDSACDNYYHSYLRQIFPIGTYYVVSEGYSQNGNITTAISGRMLSPSEYPQTDAGAYSQSFTYSNTKDTDLAGNYYQGKTSKDVRYKFALTRSMEITISHCGSALSDTYLSLFNASGTQIGSNDDYGGPGHCTNPLHSYLKQTLSAGIYYVVSEGYSQNGNITTTIQGYAPSIASTPSSGQNYIRTRTYHSADEQQFSDQIQYFDGLGRPTETVQSAITPSGKDLVSRIEYDSFGRESKQWLPAPSSNSNGIFNGATTATAFYSDTKAYSETVYEPSPLNRVTEQYGPGQAWRTGSHSVKSGYLTNTTYSSNSQLACMYYTMQESNNQNLICKGYYPAKELYVSKTTGEDGHVSYEFTDKLGRTLLQRRILNNQNVDVNYVYDDFNRLRWVLTPLASDEMKAVNQTYNLWGNNDAGHGVSDLVYYYDYDERGRKSGQKLLNTGVENFVYDKADRLIFRSSADADVGDGERGWIFYKYDALGRQILTGIYHGDDYTSADSNLRAYNMTQQCKNYLTVETPSPNNLYGHTWNNFPYEEDSEVTQANYYDNYIYLQVKYPALNYQPKTGFGTQHSSAKGLLTGTIVKLLDSSEQKIVTVYYYDTKGNIVQKNSNDQLGGITHEYYAYNFTNQITKKRIEHTAPNGAALLTTTEEYTYHYDHAGRLQTVHYQLNEDPVVNMSNYKYDEAGRMTEKSAGGNIETTAYEYNVRNWLTKQSGKKFTELLYYETNPKSGGNTYFNGNISALYWQDPSFGSIKGHSLTYDDLNRLTDASFGVGFNLSLAPNRYNESFTYDKMGNIQTLQRTGLKDNNTFGLIDNLTMYYYNNCQLRRVDDAAGDQSSADVMEFKNGFTGADEYVHHNRIYADYNKKICQTRNNYLALPQLIQFRYGHQIQYSYDAAGVKRTVKHIESASNENLPAYISLDEEITPTALLTTTTNYINNKVYVNGQLKRILTEEGYIEKASGHYQYYYYLKDHLGNNRVVFNKTGNTEQINNYYPSGTQMAELPRRTDQGKQPYKFSNKELDRTNGLDFYDFEWRQQDPALMRFSTQDPLMEKYYAVSPYAYCANNPVNYIDPTGKDIIVLQAPTGASGNGHSAVLIGNDETGWTYVSKDGTNWFSGAIGPSKSTNIKDIKSEQEFNTKYAQNDGHPYTQRIRFTTTEEQDKKAIDAADKASKRWYSLLYDNCVDAASEALNAAGLNPGYTWYGTDNPYADPTTDKSSIPNHRFKKMAKNNHVDIYTVDLSQGNNTQSHNTNTGGNSWQNAWNIINSWVQQNPNIVITVR